MNENIFAKQLRMIRRYDPLVVYLAIITIGHAIGSIVGYIRVNYLGVPASIGQLSINSDFPSSVPPRFEISKFSYGLHYFGDFMEPFLKSDMGAPYATALKNGFGVSNYPPLGQVLFLPFRFVPYHLGLFIYLFLMVLSVIIPCWLLTEHLPNSKKIPLIILGVFLSYPLLFGLDRGNFTGFAVGLLLFATWHLGKKNFRMFGILVAIATCLKLTPIFLLFVLIRKRHWFDFFIACLTGLTLSIVSMLLFDGGFINNWKAFFKILGSVHGNLNGLGDFRGINNSPMALFQNLQNLNFAPLHYLGEVLERNFIFVISAMIVTLVIAIIRSSDSKESSMLMMTGLITLTSSVLPINFTYGLLFYLVPLLLIVYFQSTSFESYAIAALIGLLFVNKSSFSPYEALITGQSLVNPVIQISIFLICIRGLHRSNLNEEFTSA